MNDAATENIVYYIDPRCETWGWDTTELEAKQLTEKWIKHLSQQFPSVEFVADPFKAHSQTIEPGSIREEIHQYSEAHYDRPDEWL